MAETRSIAEILRNVNDRNERFAKYLLVFVTGFVSGWMLGRHQLFELVGSIVLLSATAFILSRDRTG